jgi:hypothetical protein
MNLIMGDLLKKFNLTAEFGLGLSKSIGFYLTCSIVDIVCGRKVSLCIDKPLVDYNHPK